MSFDVTKEGKRHEALGNSKREEEGRRKRADLWGGGGVEMKN
jgi:hypothetical protein